MNHTKTTRHVLWLTAVVASIVFALDVSVKLGVAASVAYIVVIWLVYASKSSRGVLLAAGVCSLLIVVGFFVSPTGESARLAVVNRSLAMMVVWGTAGSCLRILRLANLQATQQQRSEEAHVYMSAIVESSYDAIIGKDLSGTIISWNAGAELVYGYTEQEAVGQTITIILPPDADGEEPEIVRAIQTGERLDQFETVRQRKDGELISVSLTVSPIGNDLGQIIGSSTIERDFTDRKRQQELRQAKDHAELANRVRAEFLANVSHELRTPMNAILGMTQLALREVLPDDIRDYVGTANDSAHSLLTLLNDILDFSKLESGKFTTEEEPFSLREVIDETVKSLSARAFEKGLELACDIAADAPDHVIGDGIRLRQVLTNLVANAIKFTERGEVVLRVKTLRNWPHETRLEFSVRDTGVGISPKDQERILEPFTQVDASSTRRYGGTGLGLAICSQLLHLMGSRMSVESEPGQGSLFSFHLSLARDSERLNGSAEFTPLERLKDMPVLIVDDNETNRQIISQMLSNWSMQPDTAKDGRQAIGRLERASQQGEPYTLIIVDALMPGMDGYELSRQISQVALEPPPVILMVASSDRREFKERESDSSISAFLQKPVSQSDLLDAVMRAMNVRAESTTALAAPKPRAEIPACLKVLVAEDTPANQKVVASILTKRGHEVMIAQNGREAVDQFRSGGFDIVLMDVQMPIMDGYQATAAIRALEREGDDQRPSTPVIAMTAHAMRGDRERCLEAGMDSYIAKPIDVNDLIELVESVAADPPETSNHEVMGIEGEREANSADEVIIDMEGAMRRLAGDMDLFRDFIGYFDQNRPGLLTTLRQAITESDNAAIQRAAHSIKGLTANFGAAACVSSADALEQMGRRGELTGALQALDDLERETTRLDRALEKYRCV